MSSPLYQKVGLQSGGGGGGEWVYAIKPGPNGEEKYKARFVAKACSQVPGVDYYETFSPTARITSVRMLTQLEVQWS